MEVAKFYLESKTSLIDKSSIASFKLFLIAWLLEYCTFWDSSVVSLKSLPWPKYTQLKTIFQKNNRVPLSNFFPLSNMFFIRLFLANIPPKKLGVTKDNLFRFRENLLRFARESAHVRALMT